MISLPSRWLRCAALLAATAAGASPFGVGQQSAPKLVPRQEQPAPAAPADLVTLDVRATDARGAHVAGLTAADFSVVDNGQPVYGFSLSASDAPSELLLVLDELNCSFEELSHTRAAVLSFLESQPHLPIPVSVAMVDSASRKSERDGKDGTATVPLGSSGSLRVLLVSQDGPKLAALLGKQKVGRSTVLDAQGPAGDTLRAQLSLQALQVISDAETDRPGHKMVVWLGPGWQSLTQNRGNKQLGDYLAYTVEGLRRARIALYQVNPQALQTSFNFTEHALINGNAQQQFLLNYIRASKASVTELADMRVHNDAGVTVRVPEPGALELQALAVESGGLTFVGNDVDGTLRAVMLDLQPYYTITYPKTHVDKAVDFHRVGVRAIKPGVMARTAADYYVVPRPLAVAKAPAAATRGAGSPDAAVQ